ncbi:MAG: hypothetical protein QGI68_14865 [Pseudomonadales bacterium]|nr:hypothetical protein [Pseudomonadales bacterium]MDP7357246.1 hypothetical protein [Pseudomonadales bacterium]MDP7596829.1 hypothetical protein [Pseudomonadales bacterium]HJN52794.1 hypothetical protein [Pseudomonadales bacterium]
MPMTTTDPLLRDLTPPPFQRVWNGNRPDQLITERAADLPGVVALPVRELVPDLPRPIWSQMEDFGPTDLTELREQTRAVVQGMDWSAIEKRKTVHLLANPHGFSYSGEAYVAMLEEIAAHLRTERQARVKLRIAESMGHIDNPDWVSIFNLEKRFDDVKEVPQIGPGSKIDTRLGDMYVSKGLFRSPYFVHTHVTDLREAYLHRMVDRLYKPFGMGYARLETRSAYHFGYGPRTGQMVSRAVFESDFIQKRYTGTVVLNTTSEGVIGVEGDNDLRALDRRLSEGMLRNYGTLMRLLGEIDACIPVLDGHGCSVYTYGGGLTFSNLLYADTDFFDLDNLALSAHRSSETEPGLFMGGGDAIKSIVINYMAGGVPYHSSLQHFSLHVASQQAYKWLINEPSNCYVENLATVHDGLRDAVRAAREETGCEELMVFDYTPGAFRVTEGLARHLLDCAPRVVENVERHLLPKWMAQRKLP